jgi:hypothetical protein
LEEGIQETSFAGEFVGTDLLVIREGVQVSDTGFVRPIRLPYAYYREKKEERLRIRWNFKAFLLHVSPYSQTFY